MVTETSMSADTFIRRERSRAPLARREPDFDTDVVTVIEVEDTDSDSDSDDDLDMMEMGGTMDEKTWRKAAQEFESDFARVDCRIHRFPVSLRGIGSRYIGPKVVAIGPYHRGLEHLKDMEKVKHVAAYHHILDCRRSKDGLFSYEQMKAEVFSVIGAARDLYADVTATAGIGDAEFANMLFLDGCFLLQYMRMLYSRRLLYSSLLCCFDSNQVCISNDIMLLENQLPWMVLQSLMKFLDTDIEDTVMKGVARMGRTLQLRWGEPNRRFQLHSYVPPHLLGLLRFYKTGCKTIEPEQSISDEAIRRPVSKTVSAAELAEMGITITNSRSRKLWDMGIKKKTLSGQIVVPALLLDEMRACWLVNMAALEVCIATDFLSSTEMRVVCSYLAFLAMLMDREEDVHMLRSKRVVQGELTNKQTLDFFKSLMKHISGGPLYISLLKEIEEYRVKQWMWIKVYKFVYRNYKTIAALLSFIGVLFGIFKTLLLVSGNLAHRARPE